MGIFTRFRDIVSSNINGMLDRAENPEKMIKMMIREMEETLIELKASCAGIIAESGKLRRRLDGIEGQKGLWEERASLAVEKGREDLAREALLEKRRHVRAAEAVQRELAQQDDLVSQYREDIRQLEEKLDQVKEKQRNLAQRHVRARQARQARQEIRRADTHETFAKFEDLENRIERMEAEADMVNFGRKPALEEAFQHLEVDDEIEKELEALKSEKEKLAIE